LDYLFFLYLKLSVYICKTVDSCRTTAGKNTQTYKRVTHQGRMALTGVNAQNTMKY